jgi:hypothetical protein
MIVSSVSSFVQSSEDPDSEEIRRRSFLPTAFDGHGVDVELRVGLDYDFLSICF